MTSGIRLGTPTGTARGFGADEWRLVGALIGDVLDGLAVNGEDNGAVEREAKEKVISLCRRFPIYPDLA